MDNASLNSRAAELQRDLTGKVKGLISVGWMKDDDAGPVLLVYLDEHVAADAKGVPSTFFGLPVVTEFSHRPGAGPRRPPPLPW